MKRILLCLTAVFALVSSELWAQDRTVTGRVTSVDDGTPLPGVNVVLKGTTNGTATDVDGRYSLTVPASGGTLVISFIGLQTQEVEIGNRSTIDVPMATDVTQLSEVIVTAFGVEQEKRAIGYAVQEVGSQELLKARETNVVNSLTGKIAGVNITNSSGAVGASSRIVIRGANSFGNNQPLFVIDGVPVSNGSFGGLSDVTGGTGSDVGTEGVNRGNGAADLNPDDIESITVLKGPNAAALYGSRASNGVILVTTKSGKRGSGLGIQVNSNVTFDTPLILPNFQNEYGQGSNGEFAFVNGAGGGTNDGTDESWGPRLDIGLMIPQFNSPVVNGVRQPTPWVSHPDNVKNLFETGTTVANSIAITGGNDKAGVRLSYTNQAQKGMVPNTDQEKNTIALNVNANLTDKFSINAVGNYVNTHSDNLPGYGYSAQNIIQQLIWFGRQVDIAALKAYENPDGSKYNWNYNYHNNPYFTLYENLNPIDRNRIFGNIRANYRFTDWLTAFVRTGTDYYTNRNSARTAFGDIDGPFGSYSETSLSFAEVNTDFLISINKDFSENVGFALNLGGNRMDQNTSQITGNADELAVADVYTLNNSRVPLRTTSTQRRKRINSLYFSGQLSYLNSLFIDFTGRNDWSSTLPAKNNSYFYPSVSLSAVLSDLFNVKSQTLSLAKLRAGWAKVGSDTDPYKLVNYMSFGDAWNASTKLPNQFVPNELPNADLNPQFTSSIEVGAELGFFGNRLGLDVTYYDSKTTDQIISIPVSGASGYLSKNINAGEITNKGIEVALNATPVRSQNGFSWDVTVNFARNVNRVESLAPGVDSYVLGTYWSLQVAAIPGEKFGSLVGYGYLRDPQGRIIHEDGLPVIDPATKILGNYTPDWTGGLMNQFSYKGLGLSVLIDTKRGGDIYTMTTTWGRYAGVLDETLKGREHGITGAGVKNVGSAEAPEYQTNDVVVTAEEYNKAAYSNSVAEGSIFDASFVKLREMRLSYTLPDGLFGKLPFRDVNISVIGRNLALLYSKVPHIDPETAFSNSNVQGLEFGQLPSARSIGFNVSFKLQ